MVDLNYFCWVVYRFELKQFNVVICGDPQMELDWSFYYLSIYVGPIFSWNIGHSSIKKALPFLASMLVMSTRPIRLVMSTRHCFFLQARQCLEGYHHSVSLITSGAWTQLVRAFPIGLWNVKWIHILSPIPYIIIWCIWQIPVVFSSNY